MRAMWVGARFATLLSVTAVSCGSNHHVSPWIEGLSLSDLALPADLDAHMQRIEEEMATEKLSRSSEIRGKLSDGTLMVARAYSGVDSIGRPRHAVRVATGFGVVLAVGPQDIADMSKGKRTLLRSGLGPGGLWMSGTDINADGCPDVIIAGDDGTFEIWCIRSHGAALYPISMLMPPNDALDIDGDGRPELSVRAVMSDDDVLRPNVIEIAAFQAGEYRRDLPVVRAHYQRQLDLINARASNPDAGTVRLEDALSREIERAWLRLRSGEPNDKVMGSLEAHGSARAPMPAGVLQSWIRWRGWLQDRVR